MDRSGLSWTEVKEVDQMDRIGPTWTDVDQIDLSGPNMTDLICFLLLLFSLQLKFLCFKYIIQISLSLKEDYRDNQNSLQNYT